MRPLMAFMKKEILELYRNGKLLLVGILFVLFGIMNPAIAKLTPWIMELSAESLKESGMVLGSVSVDAMTSWGQFYKNISMVLMVFVVLFSGSMTNEYQKGTLINMLTKGLERWKVVAAKALVLFVLWSVCYWMHFGITYGYTAYFWDNSIASNLAWAAVCPYLFGVWLIGMVFLFSSFLNGNIAVLIGIAVAVGANYLVGIIPKAGKYLPVRLLSSSEMLTGAARVSDFYGAMLVTLALCAAGFGLAVVVFNRKNV